MSDDLTGQQALQIVKQSMTTFTAAIQAAQMGSRQKVQGLTIDLSTERLKSNALKVSFPFKSLYVEQASDANCIVNVIPESQDDGVGGLQLSLKDSITDEFGFRCVYLYWPAQAGKSMVIKFFTTSNFTTGSLVQAAQSQLPTKSIGAGTAPLDGLTVSVYFNWDTTPTGADVFQVINQGFNGSSEEDKSNQVVTVAGSAYGSFWGVPTGYNARLIGAEMEIFTASGQTVGLTGTQTLSVLGAKVGTNYAALTSFDSFFLLTGAKMQYMTNVVGTKKLLTRCIPSAPAPYLPQNTVPFLYLNNSSGTGTYGSFPGQVRLLFRLEKVVG